jgi:WD40 repeat protein/serine/threonine protein kinase
MPQEFAQWNVGDVILDLYKVTDTLGEGGFGKVYKVRHQGLNIDLVVKVPQPSVLAAAGGVEQFERNVERWVKLGLHPHIVSCYYVRLTEGVPLVFAEYVATGSLHDWIRSRQLYVQPPEGDSQKTSLKRILDIAIQFAWGLHYAHEQGLIHLHVKPSNVAVAALGVVKVTDFGLANPHATQHQERQGAILSAYCSPEQVSGQPLTLRTDLWGWALSVLEMFQGERTWTSGTVAEQALKDYLQTGPVDRQLPLMPVQLSLLLGRCFRTNPDERPRNLLEVANELVRIYWQVTESAYSRWEPNLGKNIPDILNNRAVSLLDLGRQDEALQLWEQALYMQQPHPESTYNRGLILWRTARMSDDSLVREIAELENALPKNWGCLYLLALIHLERDDCEAALQTLNRCEPRVAKFEVISLARREAQARYPLSHRLLRTFVGHAESVNSVCLSANSQFALSAGKDETLKLWDVANGKCLRTFFGHTGEVRSICLSADARFALSGSKDNTLKLWDVANSRCLLTFEGHYDSVESVCLSSDGRFALSGSSDYTLKLWDVASAECLRTFEEHVGSVNSVCLSADARTALSGSDDKTLKLWDVDTGRCLRTFKGHTGSVNSICLSADARKALSGSKDNTLKLWDVATNLCLSTFAGHADEVNSVSLSADARFALSSSQDNTLKLWDLHAERCLRTFAADNYSANSVFLSLDTGFALSGSADNTVKLWAVNSWTHAYVAPMMLSPVMANATLFSISMTYERELQAALTALDTAEYVAAAGHIRRARSLPGFTRHIQAVNTWMRLYTALPRKALTGGWACGVFTGHTQWVNSVCLSADARLALSGSHDQTLKLWDVNTGRCLRTFEGHTDSVTSVCLSADAQVAFSGSEDDTLKLWDVDTGGCLLTVKANARGVYSVCLSADARTALAGCDNNTLNLWDLATGACIRTFEGHSDRVNSVCMSADGRFALSGAGTSDKTLKLWEVETGRCLRTFAGHAKGVNSVCLSVDGRVALSGSEDNTLKLWDAATGNCLLTFEAHKRGVTSVCLSSDGRVALSGSYDNTLKMWEVASGRCMRTFAGHNLWVNSVFLSSDARFALSGSYDNTLKLWALDWELESAVVINM